MGVGQRRDIIILGSTGSIGRQALEVVAANPDRFRIVGLGAGGGDPELLARQVIDFAAPVVAVARGSAVEDVQLALYAEAQRRDYPTGTHVLPRLLAGPDAAVQLARTPCDVVLNAITGSVGLLPTLATLESGTRLALANKESLIVGGPLVEAAAAPGQLVPVDSEHSAIAQALRGERPEDVRRLVVTASGGPFRGRTRTDLVDVTPEQARAHPTWDMGPVITINSATLVNKGLEVIEAHLLFGIDFDAIDVVVHPTSVVHSMVEFVDGSTIAQASPPDMRLPIALGLGWPERVPGAASACDWSAPSRWEFSPLDESTFPAVRLARAAGEAGRTAPAVYNAANEVCVNAFVAGELPFLGIVDTVESVLEEHLSIEQLSRTDVPSDRDVASRRSVPSASSVQEAPLTVDDVLEADAWARDRAHSLIQPYDREGAR